MDDKLVSARTVRRRANEQTNAILSNNLKRQRKDINDSFFGEDDINTQEVTNSNYQAGYTSEASENLIFLETEVNVKNTEMNTFSHGDPFETVKEDTSDEEDYSSEKDLSSDGDSSLDENYSLDEDVKETGLKEKLRQWAIESGTKLCHANTLLTLLKEYHPELPKDARTLLQTNQTCSRETVHTKAGCSYCHFGLTNGVQLCLAQSPDLLNSSELYLQLNIDGLPIFKSSPETFWPILGSVHLQEKLKPFLIGLWVGKSKPTCIKEYLDEFIKDLSKVQQEGITYGDTCYKVKILNFICDTPARAFVKQTKGHTGFYGCDYCMQRGKHEKYRMTFPLINASPRTDNNFRAQLQEEHHRSSTPLLMLQNVDLIAMFPLDYMHLLCLGVVKKC